MAETKIESFVVEAVLRVKDAGFLESMNEASKIVVQMEQNAAATDKQMVSFGDTMKSFVGTQIILKGLAKGWDIVRGSVDKALGRIDTMDQFNRSIQLMTGSTEEAGRAVQKVNDYVKGTAYGLDVAASSVQGLVTAGKDIDSAVESVSLFGDALATFGEASNEALGSVSYSLQKVATQGKVSGETFRELANRGIPAMQIFAEASGKTGEEVAEQLRKGAISSEEFFSVMRKGFKEGTESFPALAGAAKEAGASWSATIANSRAAVTRGVQDVISSWEKGRKEANLPGTKENIAKAGKVAEKALKGVGVVAEATAKISRGLISVGVSGLSGIAAHKAWNSISRSLTDHRDKVRLQKEAWNRYFTGFDKGTKVTDIYARAISKSTIEEEKRAIAAKMGLIVTKEGNIVREDGAALSNAEAIAFAKATTTYEMQIAAEKMGLVVNKAGNIVKRDGTAISVAQQAALLAETGAISLQTVAHGVLNGQIAISTAAQIAFNAAIKANPIGLIITGITLAVAALIKLNKWLNRSTKEQEKASEQAQELSHKLDDLGKSGSEANMEFERQIKLTTKGTEGAKGYAESLGEIAKSGKTAEEKQAAYATTVDKLKSIYPDLAISSKQWSENAKDSVDSVNKQINALDKLTKVDAYKKHLKELQDLKQEQEVQLEIAKEQLRMMEESGTSKKKIVFGLFEKDSKETKELRASIADLEIEYGKLGEEISATEKTLSQYDERQIKANLSAAQAKANLEILATEYGRTDQEAQKIVDSLQAAGASFNDFAGAAGHLAENLEITKDKAAGYFEALGISASEAASMSEDQIKSLSDGLEDLAAHMGTTTDTVAILAKQQGLSIEELGEQYQIHFGAAGDAMQELAEMGLSLADMAKLSGGNLESLGKDIESLAERMGVSTESIVNMARQQGLSISEMSDIYEKRLASAESAISKFTDSADAGFSKLEQSTTLTFSEIQANLDDHIEALKTWKTNVDILMDAGIDQGVIAKLKDMGEAGAEQAKVLVDELTKANGQAIKTNADLSQSAQDLVAEVNASYEELYKAQEEAAQTSVNADLYIEQGRKPIVAFVQGLASELDKQDPKIKEAWGKISKGAEEAVKNTDFSAAYSDIDSKLEAGTKETADKQRCRQSQEIKGLQSSLEKDTKEAISSASSAVMPSFRSFGESLGEALVAGIRAKKAEVERAVLELTSAAKFSLSTPGVPGFGGGGASGLRTDFDARMKAIEDMASGLHSSGTDKKQPMNINLTLGGKDFEAFSDDIYKQNNASQRMRGRLGV